MKRKAWIAVLTAVIVTVLAACGGAPAENEVKLTGEWVLDGARTEEENGVSLRELYGSALSHYGASLRVGEDGSIGYYIGVFEGQGTWQADEEPGHYTAELVVYPEETKETLTFYGSREGESGTEYLVLEFSEYVLCWVRAGAE